MERLAAPLPASNASMLVLDRVDVQEISLARSAFQPDTARAVLEAVRHGERSFTALSNRSGLGEGSALECAGQARDPVPAVGSVTWRDDAAFSSTDETELRRAATRVPGTGTGTALLAVSRAGFAPQLRTGRGWPTRNPLVVSQLVKIELDENVTAARDYHQRNP